MPCAISASVSRVNSIPPIQKFGQSDGIFVVDVANFGFAKKAFFWQGVIICGPLISHGLLSVAITNEPRYKAQT